MSACIEVFFAPYLHYYAFPDAFGLSVIKRNVHLIFICTGKILRCTPRYIKKIGGERSMQKKPFNLCHKGKKGIA